jgi:hypothetical protein
MDLKTLGGLGWLGIAEFLDFAHSYGILKSTTFWNLDLFRPQMRGWEVPALLGPLERSNLSNWTSDRLILPETQ